MISNMSGGKSAWPLLISCANISKDFRNKASNHAYQLLALLPVPTFINPPKDTQTMLQNRVFQECLRRVLVGLFKATLHGDRMSD